MNKKGTRRRMVTVIVVAIIRSVPVPHMHSLGDSVLPDSRDQNVLANGFQHLILCSQGRKRGME